MKKRINILLVIIWMLLIFIMSSFDGTKSSNQSNFIVTFISQLFNISNVDNLSFIIRKTAHFTEYLILGLLVYNMLKDYSKHTYIAIIICIIYAISDEIHQIYVAGRTFKLLDIIIDTIGSICGITIMKYITTKLKRKIRPF